MRQRYAKMKASGMNCLGDMPPHSQLSRLKFLLKDRLRYGANEEAQSDDQELPRYVRITDIAENGTLYDETFRSLPPDVAAPYLLREGDILFARSGATAGKTFLYTSSWGVCAHAGYLIRARLNQRRIIPEFVRYFTASAAYWEWVSSAYIQATIQNVSAEKYAELWLPVPPPDDQRVTVKFLDRKTTEIDTLVAKKRALIEKLKEKRSALISRTVTRGLPSEAASAVGFEPNRRLKQSGVEWLGEVPEHWEVKSVSRVAASIQTGPFGSQLHESDFVDGGIPLINPAHIVEGCLVPDDRSSVDEATAERLSRHQLKLGDIIMGRRGEIGRCAVTAEQEQGWLCGTGSLRIRIHRGKPKYFSRIIGSAGFSGLLELNAVGTTMLNLNPTIVGRMLVPVPLLPEQQAITDFLDRETAKIDALVAKIERAIDRLQEYRTALITAAVTGKIDVRQEQSGRKQEMESGPAEMSVHA